MSDPDQLPVELPREWIRYAEGDLGVAQRELLAGTPSWHTICFLCQTAAEKFLKGYLLAQGWELERTHDLLRLLDSCSQYDVSWKTLVPDGQILNDYIVAGRYPSDLSIDDIGRPEAEEAIRAT